MFQNENVEYFLQIIDVALDDMELFLQKEHKEIDFIFPNGER